MSAGVPRIPCVPLPPDTVPLPDAVAHRHAGQLATLRHLSIRLGQVVDPTALPGLLVESLVNAFDASWAALYGCHPDGSLSRHAVHPPHVVEVPATISGEDAERLEAMQAPPVLHEHGTGAPVAGLESASMLMPIEDVRARLGWIAIGPMRGGGREFDLQDAHFLALIASVTAPRLAFANFLATHGQLALTDPLTGFGNRRAFDQRLEEEVARASRSGIPFCLLLIGLDDLAGFNQAHGRDEGDRALAAVAVVVNSSIRRSDTPFRLDGDTMAVVIWNADPTGTAIVADRIQAGITRLAAPAVAGPLTLDTGIATLSFPVSGPLSLSSITLQKKADEALYRARRARRGAAGRSAGA